ncbi:MAG: hypothetical protein NXI35_21520 [bacterium]|nr:hypothetical protein [bacterium]
MRRLWALWMICSASLACTPRSKAVPPPKPAAPSTLVRGEEGVNKLVTQICGQPCDTALEGSASTLRTSVSGTMHMERDAVSCSVPGFFEEPATCSAVCVGDVPSVTSVLIDMGPIGPNTRSSLCMALERDRGEPTRGSCDDVCEGGMGCAWPQTDERAALEFVGHVALQCPGPQSSLDPNQSDGSNSMSP